VLTEVSGEGILRSAPLAALTCSGIGMNIHVLSIRMHVCIYVCVYLYVYGCMDA